MTHNLLYHPDESFSTSKLIIYINVKKIKPQNLRISSELQADNNHGVNDMNYVNSGDIPMGFGMALAQNSQALAYFAGLPDYKKQLIIEGTHAVESKEEMQQYVIDMIGAW